MHKLLQYALCSIANIKENSEKQVSQEKKIQKIPSNQKKFFVESLIIFWLFWLLEKKKKPVLLFH